LRVSFDKVGKYGLPDATAGYYIEYAHEIIEFLDENDKILHNILESEVAGSIINVMIAENLKETRTMLHSSVEKGLKLSASVNTVADMLVGGVTVVVLNWFTQNRPIPKEVLLKEIAEIIKLIER